MFAAKVDSLFKEHLKSLRTIPWLKNCGKECTNRLSVGKEI